MTGLVSSANPPSQLPVTIDYPAALAARAKDMSKYLLAPAVCALLHFMPNLRRMMLFTTLWNTGARISEALALTRGDFLLRKQCPFVQLATLKQRARIRPSTGPAAVPHRLVPLSDA